MQEFDFRSSDREKTISMTNTSSTWDFLSPDLTELILSYLPIPSIISATSVCKLWNYIIHSHSFITRKSISARSFPWFVLSSQHKCFSENNQLFAFDPESNHWVKLPNTTFLSKNSFSISNEFLFTTCQTSPVRFSGCNSRIGGLEDIQTPLPEVFRPGNSSKLLSSALFNRKIYLLGIYSNFISSFDLEKHLWSNVQTLRPPGVMFSYLISCQIGLVFAGLCSVQDYYEFNLWRIDEKTLEFSEIGIMPCDLLSGFLDGERDGNFGRLKCVGSGNVVYVFDDEYPWNHPICVCEFSGSGKCSWRRIMNLPGPVNKLDKFISSCSYVSVLDVLGNATD
ncbi:hypothetical protein BUALT_Bualt02G0194400 [Buddleja alternifolia]|uniref:F-box domain-containing protein n=1 Tax=Buddleja alternifolia TaxID=168488 RepID=A0AAV6YA75_9LAMI|nr:hypothetical protein BUALT_Bualt02G0194400 [Buddleja alternifolia]